MTQTGREFMREAGADPQKWAQRYLDAYDDQAVAAMNDADRLEFTAQWFEDFAEAVLKAKPKPILEE